MVGVLLFMSGLLAGGALARAPSVWDGMAETTALKLGTASRQLSRTAGEIAGAGRVGELTLLRSDTDEVLRRADALARMAKEPLPAGK
jgi:hypothetical protein